MSAPGVAPGVATDRPTPRGDADRVSTCERALRDDDAVAVDSRASEAVDGGFEVVDPVPVEVDADAFRVAVETVAERHGLAVRETDNPFRLVVAVA